jgi:hypothetical protein
MKFYLYNFMFRRYNLILITISIIWYVICLKILGVPTAECEGSYIGNLLMYDEKNNVIRIQVEDKTFAIPASSFADADDRADASILVYHYNPDSILFDMIKEFYAIKDRYLGERYVEVMVQLLPPIEESTIFAHPIIKPEGSATLTNVDRLTRSMLEYYYQHCIDETSESYVKPEILIQLCTTFKLYVACAASDLGTDDAKDYILSIPVDDYKELFLENKNLFNLYTNQRLMVDGRMRLT